MSYDYDETDARADRLIESEQAAAFARRVELRAAMDAFMDATCTHPAGRAFLERGKWTCGRCGAVGVDLSAEPVPVGVDPPASS